MKNSLTLGEKLSDLRKAKKVKQADVACYIGVKESTVSSYELDDRKPSIDILGKLADFYNVSCDYLLGREADLHSHHDLGNKFIVSDNGRPIKVADLLAGFYELSYDQRIVVLKVIDMMILNGAIDITQLMIAVVGHEPK